MGNFWFLNSAAFAEGLVYMGAGHVIANGQEIDYLPLN
jgi:hypothetical protein